MRLDPVGEGPLVGEGLDLTGCYELCRQVQKGHSRTYYFSTSLFPEEARPHVHALYAFMRYADEIVDNPGATTLHEQLAGLRSFEEDTLAAVAGEAIANPVLRAFANTVLLRGIGPNLIEAFMRSMKMDTGVFRYPTYEDLEEYTYGSAAAHELPPGLTGRLGARAGLPAARRPGTLWIRGGGVGAWYRG